MHITPGGILPHDFRHRSVERLFRFTEGNHLRNRLTNPPPFGYLALPRSRQHMAQEVHALESVRQAAEVFLVLELLRDGRLLEEGRELPASLEEGMRSCPAQRRH